MKKVAVIGGGITGLSAMHYFQQLKREKIRLGLMKKPEGFVELKGEDKQYTPKRKAQNSMSLLIRSRRRER